MMGTELLGMEIGLAGHSILASAAGFAAARYDLESAPSNAAFMEEARPVLAELLPELEAEGLNISHAREFLAHLDGDVDNGISASLWMMKLSHTLEGFSKHPELYEKATNRIWERGRFVFNSAKHASLAREVYGYTQNREFLASLRPYSQRYHELGPVAKGAQATIYLVEELDEKGNHTGTQYVSRKIHGAESVGRFYDYAKALEQLEHPNIVRLHEVTVDNGDFIIVMEIAKGQDLKAHLEHGAPLTAVQIFNLREQLLGALRYAWRCGIIHRDLKPNNVMMHLDRASGDMRLTLLDFGMAKFKEADSRASSMWKGTFFYWAPEQFEGKKITEATDIYQTGLVLLDLVRGRMRTDTIVEQDPLAEIPPLRALHADDSAMQKLLDEIALMCNRDPKMRMGILGASRPAEPTDLATAEAEAEVEADAPTSLALNLHADISAESAMAMVDQRPPRWLYPRSATWITSVGALVLAGIGALPICYPRSGHEMEAFVIGGFSLVAAAVFGTMPFWDKKNKRKPEQILKGRAIKTLTHTFQTTEDEELRISAAKALVETDQRVVYQIFVDALKNPKTRRAAIYGLGENSKMLAPGFLYEVFFEATPFGEEYFLILDAMMKREPKYAAIFTYLFKEEEDASLYERITYPEVNAGALNIILHPRSFSKFSPNSHPEVYKRAALLAIKLGRSGETHPLQSLGSLFGCYVLPFDDPKMIGLGEAILQAIQSVGGAVAKAHLGSLEADAKKIQNKFWQEKIRRALAAVL